MPLGDRNLRGYLFVKLKSRWVDMMAFFVVSIDVCDGWYRLPYETPKVNVDECLVRFDLIEEGVCGYTDERSR